MGWDSNPRDPCGPAGFQDRCLQPLGHPSSQVEIPRCQHTGKRMRQLKVADPPSTLKPGQPATREIQRAVLLALDADRFYQPPSCPRETYPRALQRLFVTRIPAVTLRPFAR